MNSKQDSNSPSNKTDDKPSSEVPAIEPAPSQNKVGDNPTTSANNQENTARELAREFRWIEIWTLIINGVLAIVGIVALTVYSGQLKVMQGQLTQMQLQLPEIQRSAKAAEDGANLARQQAIALQQAVVKMWFSDFVIVSPDLHPALPIAFRNDGIAIATKVSFHGAFTWKSEPRNIIIGHPTPVNIEIPSMQPGDKGGKSYTLTIPDLTQERLKAIHTSTKTRTIEFSGKFTYSNGFDQTISEDICKIYFAHEQLGNSSDAGFIDCDQYAAKVKLWENLEREHR